MSVVGAEELRAERFERITDWVLVDGAARLASLDWKDSGGWLYAFVVNDSDVRYVGMTDRILRSRMDDYRDGKVDQNARLRSHITEQLEAGRRVSVYGRREPKPEQLSNEELRLRNRWKPVWNRM